MHLTDPNRPQINGLPAYGSPPIAVLPEPRVWPISSDECTITVVLAVTLTPLRFSAFGVTRPLFYIPVWISRYYTDPEQTLLDTFNWTPPTQRSYHGFAKGIPPNPLDNLEIE